MDSIHIPFSRWAATLALLWAVLFIGTSAHAAATSATATLSSDTAAVGETIRLEIRVTGLDSGEAPEINVPGLSIRSTGSQRSIEMKSFRDVRASQTFFYFVVPQREGTFTIPSVTSNEWGNQVRTEPLTLTVTGHASRPAPPRGGTATEPGERRVRQKIAFAEWVLPKTTAYVGETIPAEVRVYLATNIRWTPPSITKMAGEGFAVEKFTPNPKVTIVSRDGQQYHLMVVKTAVTPAKVGKLTLDPAELVATAHLPRQRQRPRMPGFDDFFDDPFFNSAFMVEEQVPIRSEPLEVEVKPLPTKDRPESFSGAIGQFALKTDASPTTVQVGDPVTLNVEISGVGNFSRVDAPTLAETAGWKAYPPSVRFDAEDENSIAGTKRFEYALIPDRPLKTLPEVSFAYFDPSKGEYQTLTAPPIAVTVEGSAAPATPTPAPATAAATPGGEGEAGHAVDDILPIRVATGREGLSFRPLWERRGFWSAQVVPLAALLLLAGWQIRRRRAGDTGARRLADLRRRKQEAARTVADPGATAEAFYAAALRHLQIETVLRSTGAEAGREPAALDAEAVCASRPLDPAVAAAIRSLFAAHDELRYAGGGDVESLSPERRAAVRQTLQQFDQSHA